MSYLLGFVSLCASTALSSSSCAYELVDCGYGGGCTWRQAKKACEKLGENAGLALIRDDEQAKGALKALADGNGKSAWVGLAQGKVLNRVLGTNYKRNDWLYADETDCNKAQDMPYWADGEPGYKGACASITVGSGYTGSTTKMMKSERCNTQHQALCQTGGDDYEDYYGYEDDYYTEDVQEDTQVQARPKATPEPTPRPTPKPTPFQKAKVCKPSQIQKYTSNMCTAWGDPHITSFQGVKVEQMGQPNNFYYMVAKCAGVPQESFPIQIVNFFRDWSGTGMTINAYSVGELFTREGKRYFVWMENDGVYWAETAKGLLPERRRHQYTAIDPSAGSVFFGEGNQIEVSIAPIGSIGHLRRRLADLDFMHSHRDYQVTFKDHINNGQVILRTNGHSLSQISVSDEYKCNSCGLCGDFKHSGPTMLNGCGQAFTYSPNPTIYKDLTGWGYQYQFYNNQCGRKQVVTAIAAKEARCPVDLQRMAEQECKRWHEDAGMKQCCAKLKGSFDCKKLRWDCTVDACQLGSKYLRDAGNPTATASKEYQVNKAAMESYADIVYGECGASLPAMPLVELPGDDAPIDEPVQPDEPSQPSQPSQPGQPNELLLTVTPKTLTALALILVNILAVTAIVYYCRVRSSSRRNYSFAPVKHLESEEEEEQQIIAQ